MGENKSEILIYETESGAIEVQLEQETLWLSLQQITDLFGRDKSVISRHLGNIFKTNELERSSVVAKNATTAADGKSYQVDFYNLDAIISVGYRVNSRQGTQFRIWASRVLKEHLVKGYTLNEQRLRQHQEQLKQLEQTLTLFQQNIIGQANLPEAKGLVDVITGYARTFVLLNQFDNERLPTGDFDEDIRYEIKYGEAKVAINVLKQDLVARSEATELVGNEKDDSFAGILVRWCRVLAVSICM